MLQYEVAKSVISELQSAASRARLAREVREANARRRHRPLRVVVGRRLVRIGLRLAAAQG